MKMLLKLYHGDDEVYGWVEWDKKRRWVLPSKPISNSILTRLKKYAIRLVASQRCSKRASCVNRLIALFKSNPHKIEQRNKANAE